MGSPAVIYTITDIVSKSLDKSIPSHTSLPFQSYELTSILPSRKSSSEIYENV